MDVWTPTIKDLLDNEYYYWYKQYLDQKINFEEWMEIKNIIWDIKDLLKKIPKK